MPAAAQISSTGAWATESQTTDTSDNTSLVETQSEDATTDGASVSSLNATSDTTAEDASNDVNAPGVDTVVNPSTEASGPLPTATSSWTQSGTVSGSERKFTIKYENKGSTAITKGRIWHQFMARVGHTTTYSVECKASSDMSCPTNGTNASIPSGTNTITGTDHIYYRTFWAVVDIPVNASLTFTITTTTTTTSCADSTTPMIGGWARFSRTGFTMPDDIDASASNAGVITGVTQCDDGTVEMTNKTYSPGPEGTPSRVLSGDYRTFKATWKNTSASSVTVPIKYTYYVPYTNQDTEASWSCTSTAGSCPAWAQSGTSHIDHDNAGEDADVVFGGSDGTSVTLAGDETLEFTITLKTTINTCTQDGYLRVQTYAGRGSATGETTSFRTQASSELVEIGCSTWMLDEDFSGSSVSDPAWNAVSMSGRTNAACLTAANGAETTGTTLGKCTGKTSSPSQFTDSGSVFQNPSGTNTGYLQLTDQTDNQAGAVVYNKSLPSENGLVVTFTQYQFGTDDTGADGIGFFLADGSTDLTAVGPYGGALGYPNSSVGAGLPHGYLGIGFDTYGNYANLNHSATQCKATDAQNAKFNFTSESDLRPSIAIRGSGNGTSGYCMVALERAKDSSSPLYNKTLRYKSSSLTSQKNVRTAVNSAARPTRVTVYPLKDGQVSPRVTVEMQFPGTNYYTTVIDTTMTTAVPSLIKFGFLGSTGGSKDVHLISNVKIGTVLPMETLSLTKSIASTETSYDIGDTINYEFNVFNSSTSAVYYPNVVDPLISSISCTAPTDANGTPYIPAAAEGTVGSIKCTGSYAVTEGDRTNGHVLNTATAHASTSSASQTNNLSAQASADAVVNPTASDDSRVISPSGTATFQVVDNGSTTGIVKPDNASKLTIEVYDPNTSQWVAVPESGTTSISVTGEGTWTITAGNTVAFTGNDGYSSTVTPLTYRATNAYGGTASAKLSVTISVTPHRVCTATEQRASKRYWAFDSTKFNWGTTGTALTTSAFSNLTGVTGSSFTATDSLGRLQFVVDSSGSIRNAAGIALTDGAGNTVSLGALSGASPVTAFPVKQGSSKYYVVWSTAAAGSTAGGQLKYVIVDMTAKNGEGAVTTSATLLGDAKASSAVSAVPNSDGTGYWVISPSRNASLSGYTMSAYSFVPGSTMQTVTTQHLGTLLSDSSYEDIGFNADLSRVITLASNSTTGHVYVTSFNASTGVFTKVNDHLLPTASYSLAVASDSNGSRVFLSPLSGHVRYATFDDSNAWTWKANTTASGTGTVRVGSDGKLYWAQKSSGSVAVLSSPTTATASSTWSAVTLDSAATATAGLSNTLIDCAISATNLTIVKHDHNGAAIDGASFTIYPDNGHAAADTTQTGTNAVAAGTMGTFTITGLGQGTYWLRETAAPAGHNLLAADVRVIIDAHGTVTLSTETNPQVVLSGNATDGYTIIVTDTAAVGLPLTGGQWAALLTALGILLVAAAAAGAAKWRRRLATVDAPQISDAAVASGEPKNPTSNRGDGK